MIFYFTGTGNSLHAAQQIAQATQDTLISIAETMKLGQNTFHLHSGERIGFVFPVYWLGMPTVVEEFVQKLKLENYHNQFVYVVLTYGAHVGKAAKDFENLISSHAIKTNGMFGVKTIDNYIIMKDVPKEEQQLSILKKADSDIEQIIDAVREKQNANQIQIGLIGAFSHQIHNRYKKEDHTKKFVVTEQCNGCGKCERNCPCTAISLVNGKPKWSGSCTFCLACINRCPKQAIQYGPLLAKQGRYVHPCLQKA
ncbi:EFR1 family ferrodoxin [Oscillospiraceae bacterium PP1C4]